MSDPVVDQLSDKIRAAMVAALDPFEESKRPLGEYVGHALIELMSLAASLAQEIGMKRDDFLAAADGASREAWGDSR